MKTTSDRVGLDIAYSKANSTLPEKLPYIENKEAEKAYKLLVRKFGKKEMMFLGTWKKVKMRPRTYNRPRKVWVCLSGKDEDGIVRDSQFFDLIKQLTNCGIQIGNHGSVGGIEMRFAGRPALGFRKCLRAVLNLRVNGVMRHLTIERSPSGD